MHISVSINVWRFRSREIMSGFRGFRITGIRMNEVPLYNQSQFPKYGNGIRVSYETTKRHRVYVVM